MHAIFDHNAGGMIVVDSLGIIKSANFIASQIFGYSVSELEGQQINTLFPKDSQNVWNSILNKFSQKNTNCMFEGSAIRQDGAIFSLEMVLASVSKSTDDNNNNDNMLYACSLRDNSRKELSEKIDNLINAVLRRVLRGEDVEEFSYYICEKVMQMFNFSLVWIGLKNANGTLQVISASGENTEELLEQSNKMRWDSHNEYAPYTQQVIKSMETVVTNISKDEKDDSLLKQIVTIPLLFQGKILGLIELHIKHGKLDEKILHRLETLALRLTMAIQIAKDQRYVRLLGTALQSSANAVLIVATTGTIEWVNQAFSKITGYSSEEVIGQSFDTLKSGYYSGEFYKNMWNKANLIEGWTGEVVKRHKLGALYTVNQTITPIKNNLGETVYFVISQEDLTAKKVAENRILKLANYDQLTGLPNRKSFHNLLEKSLHMAKSSGTKVAVIFISLVNFNRVNETFGYSNSDKIIKIIAERIESTINKEDVLARMSFNEFAIILHNISDLDVVSTTSRNIINKIFNTIEIDGDQINQSSCIGISIFPDNSDDAIKLANYADISMHKAINTIHNSYFFFSPEINAETEDRIALERDIKKAVSRNEFVLHYQPQIDIRTNRLVGFEALVRWQHPERGMVSPAKFIPIAESTGAIIQIGDWVFKEALEQWRKWADIGLYPNTIAVNVSAIQFQQENLVDTIETLLAQTDVQPDNLEIELTESIVMQDAQKTDNILNKLSAMGVQISIDDFGTGYSSLSYLKKFPIDRIKIDQSFVKEMTSDYNDAEIARAIINLGHCLGLEIVSEGVENEAQLHLLREQGCDITQGYLTGRPMPADVATEIMKEKIKHN